MNDSDDLRTNRLAGEKSPYLLQHARNPVDWYPWGDEAFRKAETEDKPVFLSIGYSTCHWCHVMERESFDDPEVAELLNDGFVSVKVDREERPDIDNVYMTACRIMTGAGGWPLTVIMTPGKKPFYAATYIPKSIRHGRPGIMELLPRITEIWETRRDEIEETGEKIAAGLRDISRTESSVKGETEPESLTEKAYRSLKENFDPVYGGFGDAPKFPSPHNLMFLLRYRKNSGNEDALAMAEKTLHAMRSGGIYDQIGFGFHRYSTDPYWFAPHFEKMLYDQALLIIAYSEAYGAAGKSEYARTAGETITYVLRDLLSPEGAFYSAEDADSEGVEGKFYLWTEEEIRKVLDEDEAESAVELFNIEEDGNYDGGRKGGLKKTNILYPDKSIDSGNRESDTAESIRQKLLECRNKRVRPHLDDKILTDWNGLMIAALAMASRYLDNSEYADAAEKAASFIFDKMESPGGGLYHRYREGEAAVEGFLDDYAFMVWGLVELYRATFEACHLRKAVELTGLIEKYFGGGGGYFFTSEDSEELIARQKEYYDGAVPSGNSVHLSNLFRLARITGDHEYEDRALELSRAMGGSAERAPSGHTFYLCGLTFLSGFNGEIIIAGEKGASPFLNALRKKYLPGHVVVLHDDGEILELAPHLRNYNPIDGKAAAYVCRRQSCLRPAGDPEKMLQLLEQ